MFTKNWYSVLASFFHYKGGHNLVQFNGNAGYVVSMSTDCYKYLGYGYNWGSNYKYLTMYLLQNSLDSGGGVVLGTGDTPPTLNDYCLSGDLITTFTYTATVTNNADEDGLTTTAVYTIVNSGDSDFTVREIALINNPSNYGSSSKDQKVLMERTVLDTPVTIPAGGVGQITYTIRFPFPTE